MQHIKDTFTKFDELTRQCGCFEDFQDLVTRPNYRPSLQVNNYAKSKAAIQQTINNARLAEAYDLYQELMGDDRRAYRF